MPLNELHHFTILTKSVENTAEFFKNALGLTDGFSPDPGFPVIWLYLGDVPVVHIVHSDKPGEHGCGRVDHVAFNCSDYTAVKSRLDECGVNQKEQTQPSIGVHQIFAESPEGVWVELVFDIEEYRSTQNHEVKVA